MEFQDIRNIRLVNQSIVNNTHADPESVVHCLGAMQAQDYQNALWAIGLRCKGSATISDVQSAIINRKIVRTWLMRGTLHFASTMDVNWMIRLFAPRLRNTALLRDRNLGLSDAVVEKTKSLFSKALGGNKQLTRQEMYKVMDRAGIPSKNNLGYHMLYRAAWGGLICFGPNEGKQQTFVLLDEWIKEPERKLEQNKILSEIATRYFTSHGPATIKDYVWWSGLKVSDAKLGITTSQNIKEEIIGDSTYYLPKKRPKVKNNRKVFLLPAFDEYIVSYADRSAVLSDKHTPKTGNGNKHAVIHSNGIFLPTIVVNGEVVGTWGRKAAKGKTVVTTRLFSKLDSEYVNEMKEEVDRYGQFLETDVVLH